MKYIFILNVFTLGNNLKFLYKKIVNICENKNIDFIIECNSDDISTEDIVKKYKRKKVILAPVGGDGMINRVLNSMDFSNNILFPIPYGTGNDLCRSLDKQFNDGLHLLDLVKINKKYFINSACFGIDSYIANSSIIRNKYIPKSLRYKLSAFKALFTYKYSSYKVFINGEIISGIKSTIAICNGMFYGGGFKIAPTSKLDDSKVDIYIFDKMSKLKSLLLMLGINSGKHENNNHVRKIVCNKLRIECSSTIQANIDGELLEDSSFDIIVINKELQLFYDSKLINLILN